MILFIRDSLPRIMSVPYSAKKGKWGRRPHKLPDFTRRGPKVTLGVFCDK